MRKARHSGSGVPGSFSLAGTCSRSDGSDGLSLRTPVALRDVKLDPLTLFEGAVAIRLDSREVNEYVPTTVDRDEAGALVRVEPFDGALSHSQQLPTCTGCGFRPCLAEPGDRGTVLASSASSACRSSRTNSDRTRLYNVEGVNCGDLCLSLAHCAGGSDMHACARRTQPPATAGITETCV